jgi:hypothetical protein
VQGLPAWFESFQEKETSAPIRYFEQLLRRMSVRVWFCFNFRG